LNIRQQKVRSKNAMDVVECSFFYVLGSLNLTQNPQPLKTSTGWKNRKNGLKTADGDAMEEKSQVRLNAEKDPNYLPYCMRCPRLVRMRKVAPFYWRCECGAEHDERVNVEYSTMSVGIGG
jgi:hypothetical protein